MGRGPRPEHYSAYGATAWIRAYGLVFSAHAVSGVLHASVHAMGWALLLILGRGTSCMQSFVWPLLQGAIAFASISFTLSSLLLRGIGAHAKKGWAQTVSFNRADCSCQENQHALSHLEEKYKNNVRAICLYVVFCIGPIAVTS